MKKKKLLLLVQMIGCILLLTMTSCEEEEKEIVLNNPPVANAGPDQTIMSPRDFTLLSGGLSYDSDGTIASYKWTTVSGPDAPGIYDDFNVELKPHEKFVYHLKEGIYQFELMVTDNKKAASRDTLHVTVLPDSLTRDATRMKKFDALWWGESCTMRINNISSVLPATGSYQVYMASYSGGGPMSQGVVQSSGWYQIQPVRSSGFWFEIKDDVLIIHAAENILCDWDDALYDVLLKWN